tara:strand:+ start:13031 stop:14848 length:1818 start_codon:yes stop_codon:yes gene_type:complete
MCGFTFIINHKNQSFKNKNKFFLEALKNRGNDSWGEYHDEDISFFFQRLSIIDHDNGNQPLIDNSKRYIICFSGEIYNYLELRKELEIGGAIFKTNSDTETILEGFKQKGENIIKKLNGMFSFVIWDKINKKAFIGRDRLGKKPLYWTKNQEFICFSNSLKSFEIFGLINKKNINFESLYNFLIFNCDIKSNNYYYNNINKFPKARFTIVEKNSSKNLIFIKYWQINFQKKNNNLSNLIQEYDELISDAVKIRLRSDTEKAIAMSGGTDSSTIANIVLKKFNQEVNLVNIDHEIYRDDNIENDDPEKIVNFLKKDLKKIKLSNLDFVNYLNKSLEVTETPHNQYNNGLLYKLCEEVGKKSKILLTGNGADEIFFGYNGDEKHYILSNFLSFPFKLVPNFKNNIFKNYIKFSKRNFLKKILINSDSSGELNYCNYLEDDFNNSNYEDILDLKLYLSLFIKSENNNYLNPDNIGLKNNVEIRSPFLDYRIIEFAASLPHKYKIGSPFDKNKNKFLPKEYLKQMMPANLINREKRGFGWNFNMNKLISNQIYKDINFESFAEFNLNKKFFAENGKKFINEIQHKLHPSVMVSRLFYNSIMLNKWINKH